MTDQDRSFSNGWDNTWVFTDDRTKRNAWGLKGCVIVGDFPDSFTSKDPGSSISKTKSPRPHFGRYKGVGFSKITSTGFQV